MEHYFLCKQKDVANNGAKGISIDTAQGHLKLFLIERNGKIYAYKNHCPHLGVQLNWQEDMFLSLDEMHIQCSTHGALFNINDGLCIAGPCASEQLTALKLEYRANGELWLQF